MPMDGLTIGAIVFELNSILSGARVDKINQPENDEVHILLRNNGRNYKLLLCSNASFSRLNITEITKTNPTTPSAFCMLLRKHLTGSKICKFTQLENDRIVIITFDCFNDFNESVKKNIILEIMGKHSNIIFTDESNKIYDSIKRVNSLMSRIRIIQPGIQYILPQTQDKLNPFYETQLISGTAKQISEKYMGISKQSAEEVVYRLNYDSNAFKNYLKLFTNKDFTPIILKSDTGEPIDFFAVYQQRFLTVNQVVCPSISQAIDDFYLLKDKIQRINERSHSLKIKLKSLLEKAEKKRALQLEKQIECSDVEKFRIYGELITANIYKIKKGAKEVIVENYYDNNNELVIPLDNTINASLNAQKYFKQYNKLKTALRLLSGQIMETEKEIEYFSSQLDNLTKCENEDDINEIRQELIKFGYIRTQKSKDKTVESKPMHFVSSSGIDIFVGKNNTQNDRLTMKEASSEDLWLHTKDTHGSHVIIKSINPDNETIEEAALLAAYYSKAKYSSLVPVDATKRKFIKKQSSSMPGKVIYTNQTTYYVTPSEDKIKNIKKL
ncbi:MAG: fibronectin/fibrinogen-binding protein [Clostridiales bacterium]|nr:fibronectin/fibrinogen-binding protein [Clostridiales bacterium]